MSSGAQDERHERFLREAKELVSEVERQIVVKKAELEELNETLVAAKQDLAQLQDIGRGRY